MQPLSVIKFGKISSNDVIRVVTIKTFTDGKNFKIESETGILNGKMTKGVPIPIKVGLQNRTISEQYELILNREIRKYKTKGYKELTENFDFDQLEKIVTDDSDVPKVMNAKRLEDCNPTILELKHYVSPKLDGVRCFLLFRDGKIEAKSRGGKHYTETIPHIVNDPILLNFFKKNPSYILDGEIYNHDLPLSDITGLVKANVNLNPNTKQLKYFIYDLAIPVKTCEERFEIIESRLGNAISDNFEVLEQIIMQGCETIMNYHNVVTGLGYEGLVLKAPNCEYGFDKRDIRCIKIKSYQDDEFEILDIKEGKRSEDFVFVLQTKEGIKFEAKPKGNRQLRAKYKENLDALKGKMGTVKYFNFSVHGKPTQPIFLGVRDYE